MHFLPMHLSLKSPNYILHFALCVCVVVCIFCPYIFYLCKSIFLNFLSCILHYVYTFVSMCTLCMFIFVHFVQHSTKSLKFLFWILGATYVWRSIIGDLRFFTFSPKYSCTGGEKYSANIVKLQFFLLTSTLKT